jgi:hypothetical protein
MGDGGDSSDNSTTGSQTALQDNWMNQGFNVNLNRSGSSAPATSGGAAPSDGGTAFDDDPLSADGFGPNDATIRVKPGPVRTTLIRPKPDTSKDYQRGYTDGASGSVGSCRVDATAEEESAYEKGYADGKAARDAASQSYKRTDDALKALPPELQHPPSRDDPEWPKWREAVKNRLEELHIDPGPVLDSVQDAAKLPDDGTKLPPSSSGPPPDPEHYNAPPSSGPSGAPPSQDDY